MDLTYHVSKDAYIELLADMIRRNERRPIRVMTLLLLTVVQMSVVILLCIFRLAPEQRVFFLVWSLLLAALTVLRRRTIQPRAKGTLQRLEYTGQLSADFWEKHQLRIANQELHLRYGAQQLSCPLNALSQVEEKTHALHLYCGGTIFDIVPEAAFSNREAMLNFAGTLRDLAVHAEAPQQASAQSAGEALRWTMEERTFEQAQYLAYRTLFYRYRFLRPATFVRLAVSVLAVINLVYHTGAVNVAVSVVILVLANLENISMIPAVCKLRIRREVGDWRGGSEYQLSLQQSTLVYSSDRAKVNIPVEKIILCEQVGSCFTIAWNSFPAVVIPAEVLQAPETAALNEQIKSLYQGKRPH